jgi:hypothetical protein
MIPYILKPLGVLDGEQIFDTRILCGENCISMTKIDEPEVWIRCEIWRSACVKLRERRNEADH